MISCGLSLSMIYGKLFQEVADLNDMPPGYSWSMLLL